ncbi:MAG: S-methyl-5-thioribose kinase [Christensenellales bacterium]|jgi:5-methylthioribose kinase
MSRFSKHFKMNEQDAIEYILEKVPDFFVPQAQLTCKEIGDGNINYVFRIMDEKAGKSVIIKHADIHARSSGQLLSTDRSRIEYDILMLEGKYAPEQVPKVYKYDPVMCCIVMEDLISYKNMRYELVEHKTFPTFAEDISTFMAETTLRTTDNIITPLEKKRLQGLYINPMLCAITERLVYTEPYTNHDGSNDHLPLNMTFYQKELYDDLSLRLEVAKLKDAFKSKTQALIHGDLHTGSIFVKPYSTKVLDPEFAFYGPIGYDVGNVIANLFFAWANAEVTLDDKPIEKKTFQKWIEDTVESVIDLFKEKALYILKTETTDPMAKTLGFAEWYVADILQDAAGVTGLELNRRTIGRAKVIDVAGIANVDQRARAERICILCAKECIMNRMIRFQTGCDYVKAIQAAAYNVKFQNI